MLLKELILTFLAVLSVLLLITYGSEATKLLGRALDGRVPVNLVGQLLLLRLPDVLGMIMPLSVLIAVVLTFGRLYQDQEMVVLHSSGIAPSYFRKVLLRFLVPLALLSGLLLNYLEPLALQYERQALSQNETLSPVAALQAGKFNSLPNNKGVLYAKSISADGRLQDIWIKYQDGANDLLLMAPQGQFVRQQEQIVLRLQNGWRYQNLHYAVQDGVPSQSKPIEVQNFVLFEGLLPELSSAQTPLRDKDLFTWQLIGSDNLKQQALVQWRLNMPLGIIALGLIGFMLAKTGPRQGRFARMFAAILLFIAFNQAMVAGQKALEKGLWSAEIGLWPITGLFLLIGFGVFAWVQRKGQAWRLAKAKTRLSQHKERR
ncbi:LPS export ABC transporter permease LptF [Thiosulfatimonas sediminis]|uniref:Lipopolysaccharide export system permease protein LptF n=2 Tax=Thiosulfatimonas sediminis TaxID=2675054 RepID=A0A6F8PT02_9GAMM|nr:LPS export ABC transporter permease LptF [Thiosulfatimonas sediminis]